MLAVLAGIALVIVAVVLWVGGLSAVQALAFTIGVIGIVLIVWWAGPATAWGRRS